MFFVCSVGIFPCVKTEKRNTQSLLLLEVTKAADCSLLQQDDLLLLTCLVA